jgi:hypothetical protein
MFQDGKFIANSDRTLLGDWHHLYPQAASLIARLFIHIPDASECSVRF